MWANNETGNDLPVAELAELAKEVGALFHRRGPAVGKHPARSEVDQDRRSLSGHKLHGPKGTGVFYVKRGTRFRSLLKGGHQSGRRAGTENTSAHRRLPARRPNWR